MKKLLTAILLSCSLNANADTWTGPDKTLHLLGGFTVSTLVTMHTKDPWEGFKWGVIAGAVKEGLDAMGAGEVSGKDFAITVLGSAIGAYTGGLIVSRNQGTTTIAYNIILK